MANVTPKPRYHDLDALRAFAMLLGILLHGMMSFIPLPVAVNATQDIYQDSPVYAWLLSAIHGFRMPLFFLLSGLFTALIWQRRGAGGLIRHRLFRIGVPLLVGVGTLTPAVYAVNIVISRNIWGAASRGDAAYVQSYIHAGRDLQAPLAADMVPGNGGTPLHLAAANGQFEIAEQLLEAGADIHAPAFDVVDGRPSMATPLHWAAFTRDARMVQLLVDRGAEVNRTDASGKTPLDYVGQQGDTSVSDVLVASGGRLGAELVPPSGAPSESRATLTLADEKRPHRGEVDYLGNWIRQSAMPVQLFALLVFFPVFVHLWFLWYLLWLVAAFVIAAWLKERFQWGPPPASMFRGPTMWLWVWPPTVALQFFMVQSFGPDTASGLIPWPPTLLYYGLFFGFGALYQCRTTSDFQLGKHYLLPTATALAILPIGIYAIGARHSGFWFYQGLASVVAATYVWLMILGLIGIFRRVFSKEHGTIRYISDASYWIYLVHLPLVQVLQAWVSDWQLASPLKLALIVAITFGLALLTYEWWVRYTWIGAILHGRKHRAAKKALPSAEYAGTPG